MLRPCGYILNRTSNDFSPVRVSSSMHPRIPEMLPKWANNLCLESRYVGNTTAVGTEGVE